MDEIKTLLAEIVGESNVFTDTSVLEKYASDESFAKEISPRFVVRVENADQVQSIVKWANQTKTPIIPVSSGGLHYKGDTVPSVPEAIVLDLSGMKKILSINSTHKMAVVEPGVTYGELQSALAKEGLTISTSMAPRAEKSVLTSVLETEPRLNALHQWNILDPLRCVEVIWGDGNRMYTGEAGGSEMDIEKQWASEKWQIEPTGPMMLDYYRMLTGAQGTMGIATWGSVKCELLPQIHNMYFISAKKLEDLIEFAYKVIRSRFSDEFFLVNSSYLASLMGKTPKEVERLRGKLPQWMALVGIAGRELLPEYRVAAQEADISEIAQGYGLSMKPEVEGIKGSQVLEAICRISGEKYWKETYKGAFRDIFFSSTLDKIPGFVEEMLKTSEETGYPMSDIGIYLQPQNMGTSYYCEFTLPFNKKDKHEFKQMEELFSKASSRLSSKGAYFMRPYGIWSKLQLNRDAQSAKMLRELKSIFDPNGIMNPGKLCNY